MRLLLKTHDGKKALAFSRILKEEKIGCQVDCTIEKDWANIKYGDQEWLLWIIDEDDLEKARRLWEYWKDKEISFTDFDLPAPTSKLPLNGKKEDALPPPRAFRHRPACTRFLLFLCIVLFVASINFSGKPELRPWTFRWFLIDYPEAYVLMDKYVSLYGEASLKNTSKVPLAGMQLLQEINLTPVWQGIYPWLVSGDTRTFHAPLFEKLKEGQVWRLVTPSFLHYDILHIFFNMMWLVFLGFQMEMRLGAKKYLGFVIVTAIFTNICQYLMSGSNFIGFSGVLAAMLGYILTRQSMSQKEFYRLDKSTGRALLYFLFGIAGVQVVFFILEKGFGISSPIGIANTAHLSGLFIGYLLAKTSVFS